MTDILRVKLYSTEGAARRREEEKNSERLL
jgi:hypothetical protein